jgi:hypothetical protein
MDPITISKLALIRQQEILEQAALDYDSKPLREYVADVGNLLIRTGQKLVQRATPTLEPQTVPSQNPAEQCC